MVKNQRKKSEYPGYGIIFSGGGKMIAWGAIIFYRKINYIQGTLKINSPDYTKTLRELLIINY
jgi:hypothetical protein